MTSLPRNRVVVLRREPFRAAESLDVPEPYTDADRDEIESWLETVIGEDAAGLYTAEVPEEA